ncbi:hypothetical protein [Rhodophyticola sp. CCM32]|nr:hypothetical protein [Rhodophyticola sp. CCM32]
MSPTSFLTGLRGFAVEGKHHSQAPASALRRMWQGLSPVGPGLSAR